MKIESNTLSCFPAFFPLPDCFVVPCRALLRMSWIIKLKLASSNFDSVILDNSKKNKALQCFHSALRILLANLDQPQHLPHMLLQAFTYKTLVNAAKNP